MKYDKNRRAPPPPFFFLSELERLEGTGGTAALVSSVESIEDRAVKRLHVLLDEKQRGEVELTPFKLCYWFELFVHSTSIFEASKGPCQRGREESVQKAVTIRKVCGYEINLGSFVEICPLLADLLDK